MGRVFQTQTLDVAVFNDPRGAILNASILAQRPGLLGAAHVRPGVLFAEIPPDTTTLKGLRLLTRTRDDEEALGYGVSGYVGSRTTSSRITWTQNSAKTVAESIFNDTRNGIGRDNVADDWAYLGGLSQYRPYVRRPATGRTPPIGYPLELPTSYLYGTQSYISLNSPGSSGSVSLNIVQERAQGVVAGSGQLNLYRRVPFAEYLFFPAARAGAVVHIPVILFVDKGELFYGDRVDDIRQSKPDTERDYPALSIPVTLNYFAVDGEWANLWPNPIYYVGRTEAEGIIASGEITIPKTPAGGGGMSSYSLQTEAVVTVPPSRIIAVWADIGDTNWAEGPDWLLPQGLTMDIIEGYMLRARLTVSARLLPNGAYCTAP